MPVLGTHEVNLLKYFGHSNRHLLFGLAGQALRPQVRTGNHLKFKIHKMHVHAVNIKISTVVMFFSVLIAECISIGSKMPERASG